MHKKHVLLDVVESSVLLVVYYDDIPLLQFLNFLQILLDFPTVSCRYISDFGKSEPDSSDWIFSRFRFGKKLEF